MSAICGLIGNYARRPAAEAELTAMLDAMALRAPDEATTWKDDAGDARMGFRWLRVDPDERNPARGAAGWHDLDAQFAVAIWDRERRRLTLARDPLGVKFLYYWATPGG